MGKNFLSSSLYFCLLQVSITFDPFLYLPVPLPQKQKVLSVFYFAKEPHKKPIKVRENNWFLVPTLTVISLTALINSNTEMFLCCEKNYIYKTIYIFM